MLNKAMQWWQNDLPKEIKVVYLALLANALPAITILMILPRHTETLFVWTINPVINARLMGVMYANALLLILMGITQTSWARVRIAIFMIAIFSIEATILTFVYIKPFLAHPWFNLAFWLTMYFILFFTAPYVMITHERKQGGKLPVDIPLKAHTKALLVVLMLITFVTGLGLLFSIETVNAIWPWTMPPLVGGLIGVLFTSQAFTFGWALWDGDWLRIKPIVAQGPITGLLFILLPLLHRGDLREYPGPALQLYIAVAGFAALATLFTVLSYRKEEAGFAAYE